MSGAVLVTGGAGYLGSVLVPALLSRGHAVRVLDALHFGEDGLASVRGHSALSLVRADVREEGAVRGALAGVEAVVHLAGVANDPSGDLDPAYTIAVNREATRALVGLAREAGVRRLVFASTTSVYGCRSDPGVDEDVPPEPLTWYARTKWEAEGLVRAAAAPGFATVCPRLGTVCGRSPRQRLDLAVNAIAVRALLTGAVTVQGGGQMRPNLHIRDAVALFLCLLDAPTEAVSGQIFNVANENLTVLEIARVVRGVVGEHVTVDVAPGHDARSYHVSSERIRRALGFVPRATVAEAVAELREACARGEITDPDEPRMHNVVWMRKQDLGLAGVP
jgi:nucleoside-diphosphate-sugar epimerase